MALCIEEIATLSTVLLLVLIKVDYHREEVGTAIIGVMGGIILLSMLMELVFLVLHIKKKCRKSLRLECEDETKETQVTNQVESQIQLSQFVSDT